MKLKITVIIAVFSLGIFVFNSPVYVHSDESHKGSMIEEESSKGSMMEKGSLMEHGSHKGSLMGGEMTAEVTESGAIKVGNTICPLSKEEVGVMGNVVEYEYEGKIYNFCCKACLKDFKKDPDKYVKVVNEMMAGEGAGEIQEADHDHSGHDH